MTTVYEDRYGVKHIAPYSFNSRIRNSLLDWTATDELKCMGTANLENRNNGMAKTPSTVRKGVKSNG